MGFVSDELRDRLLLFRSGRKGLVVLAGAGLSSESGIPTFRGNDGFWTIGSENYTPMDIATNKMLVAHPLEVWKWKLHYKNFFDKATTNKGHLAIAQLEGIFGERFRLITQNIDGLHAQAGNSPERTYLIHGDMSKVRCLNECSSELYPFPTISYTKGDEWTDEMTEVLSCPKCGSFLRPHVLLFGEAYNEEHFKLDSALYAADDAGVLIVVGTTLTTSLPHEVVSIARQRGALCINVNPVDNIEVNGKSKGIIHLKGSATDILPEFVDVFKDA